MLHLVLLQLQKEKTEREDEEGYGRRPVSTSTAPEMRNYRYSSSSSALNGHHVDTVQEENDNNDEEEEENQQQNNAADRGRKHSSAPPHLPTPTSITPLSIGFLEVPSVTPPLYNPANNATTEPVQTQERRRSISHPGST